MIPHSKLSRPGKWPGRTFDRLWPFRWKFFAYLIVGASGVLVNLAIFAAVGRILGSAVSYLLVASAIAFLAALVWNFFWNYLWTFREMRSRPLYHHFGVYALIQTLALGFNLGVLDVWSAHIGRDVIWGQLLGILVGSVWGFGANVLWNFREASSTPDSHGNTFFRS
jgi:putative flippase GtrA